MSVGGGAYISKPSKYLVEIVSDVKYQECWVARAFLGICRSRNDSNVGEGRPVFPTTTNTIADPLAITN